MPSNAERAAALRATAARLRAEADALLAMADVLDGVAVPPPPAVRQQPGRRPPDSWREAERFIRDNPGNKGDVIAREVGTSPENFRSRIFPWLRVRGFTSTPGEGGYYPPQDSGPL